MPMNPNIAWADDITNGLEVDCVKCVNSFTVATKLVCLDTEDNLLYLCDKCYKTLKES